MERGSSKHTPRLDEHMQQETESLERGAPVEAHVDEAQEHEPAGEDQPVADSRLAGGRATSARLSRDEAEARSELARFLSPRAFPGDRQALLADARGNNAPAGVLERLEDLPDGRVFENPEAVWEALGGRPERRF